MSVSDQRGRTAETIVFKYLTAVECVATKVTCILSVRLARLHRYSIWYATYFPSWCIVWYVLVSADYFSIFPNNGPIVRYDPAQMVVTIGRVSKYKVYYYGQELRWANNVSRGNNGEKKIFFGFSRMCPEQLFYATPLPSRTVSLKLSIFSIYSRGPLHIHAHT